MPESEVCSFCNATVKPNRLCQSWQSLLTPHGQLVLTVLCVGNIYSGNSPVFMPAAARWQHNATFTTVLALAIGDPFITREVRLRSTRRIQVLINGEFTMLVRESRQADSGGSPPVLSSCRGALAQPKRGPGALSDSLTPSAPLLARHRTHSWRGLFWINCHAHCRGHAWQRLSGQLCLGRLCTDLHDVRDRFPRQHHLHRYESTGDPSAGSTPTPASQCACGK